MIQKLIILGFLKRSSSSGYDIKKFIEKELEIFSKLEAQSIYYHLKKMEKEDLIKKEEVKSEKYLKKYRYFITPKGEKAFIDFCREALLSQRRPFIELDIALYFLPFLEKKEIMPLLRLRLRFLENVKKWLISKEEELKKAPKNLFLLINHQLTLAIAEKEFLENMIRAIKNNTM